MTKIQGADWKKYLQITYLTKHLYSEYMSKTCIKTQ